MTNLPNPFEFNSTVAPAMVVESAAAPRLSDPVVAAAELIPESTQSQAVQPASTAASAEYPSALAAINYELERFSDHARRRCMDKISPPLPKVERNIDSIALGAVRKALNIHPRDLDEDPPPLFLRSQIFAPEQTRGILQSILKVAGLNA